MMTETDRAWLAGLFEGEGCVYYYTRNRGRGIDQVTGVTITSTDKEVLVKVRDLLGYGGLSYRPAHGNSKEAWTWRSTSLEGVVLLYKAIKPWLMSRRASGFDLVRQSFVPGTKKTKAVSWEDEGGGA